MGETPPPWGAIRPRFRVRALFAVVCLGLAAAAFEGAARLWFVVAPVLVRSRAARPPAARPSAAELEAAGRALGLDPYEMADPDRPGRWRLRPGYRATLAELLAAKRRDGKVLTVRRIEEEAPRLGLRPEDVAVEINADGYRGPELDGIHGRVRVLTLGDSCTFGSPFAQELVYARALERALGLRGLDVEVVNGGVEGYAPADVLARIAEFRALRPEITTLYIGWNALYTDRYLEERRGLGAWSAGARLLGRAADRARARFGGARVALRNYERPKRPARGAPDVRRLDRYVPYFLPEVVRIVDEMQAAGSRVVLVTLPGLYSSEREPSPAALEIGHMPPFTDNPFVLARMAERYNDELRALARARDLTLVDLDEWCRRELQPTEAFFVDSVHLDERTQERAGWRLAEALAPLVPPGSAGAAR